MGYSTKRELFIIKDGDNETRARNHEYSIEEAFEDAQFESTKYWDDALDDVCEYSESHPDTIFILMEYGDDSDDVNRIYIRNGKYQYSEQVWSPFNEDSLV